MPDIGKSLYWALLTDACVYVYIYTFEDSNSYVLLGLCNIYLVHVV